MSALQGRRAATARWTSGAFVFTFTVAGDSAAQSSVPRASQGAMRAREERRRRFTFPESPAVKT